MAQNEQATIDAPMDVDGGSPVNRPDLVAVARSPGQSPVSCGLASVCPRAGNTRPMLGYPKHIERQAIVLVRTQPHNFFCLLTAGQPFNTKRPPT
jgi:hypothetical protein